MTKKKQLIMDLQFFAGDEKSEKPTSKKRKDARKKGQVLQSKEVNTALILLGIFLALKLLGMYMYSVLEIFSITLFSLENYNEELFTIKGMHIFTQDIILTIIRTVGPIIGIAFILGLVASYMQVGILFTFETIQFKLDKLNPIEGFKRLFSPKSLVELIKSLLKVCLLGYSMYGYIKKNIPTMFQFYDMQLESIIAVILNMVVEVGIRSSGILLILALLDYGYQWWEHEKNLRMSKQEVKQEHKQSDGDPQIKSKIKEKQRQMANARMMQDVPNADVIITNPTHFAVALKYDEHSHDAPYVLAKGADIVALNIKKIAKETDIPIVENKPLARSLYATAEIGDVIPEELYQAVAEVLAYVYSLDS